MEQNRDEEAAITALLELQQQVAHGLAVQIPEEPIQPPIQPPPGLYRRCNHYLRRCALLGCTVALDPLVAGYCCAQHQEMAAANSTLTQAFHYWGGFQDSEHMLRTLFVGMVNRVRGLEIGVPTFSDDTVLKSPPWLQTDVL